MSNVFPDAELVFLSNGPGELTTWVRPVLEELQQSQPRLYSGLRVSILLSPCVHAGGYELHIAQNFAGVDRVLDPDQFFPFLLWGNTPDRWEWRQQGVVVFLGGDQFYAVAIGKRLGYRIVTYAEWSVRWLPWIDHCGVARSEVFAKVPRRYHSKLTVVGNLITDIRASAQPTSCLSDLGWDTETEIVGLLPGSKPMKLQVGVPFCLAIADHLHRQRPQTRFIIPVAPGLTLKTLAAYAKPAQNPLITKGAGSSATLVQPPQGIPYLQTPQGCQIKLWTPYPAYDLLANCQICVTTVGANTAELTALAVPMLVVIPTQHLDLIRTWDGLWGLMANLPILGTPFASLINGLILKQGLRLRAWPNIWAQQEIVPELVGEVSAQAICDRLQALLETPTDLQHIHQVLQTLRGNTGSVQRLVKLIVDVLPSGT